MTVHGYHDLRFESVREAFAALLAEGQTRGAALCVQVGGETVLDLWGGVADRDGQMPWHTDTLVNLFSATKAFTSVAALQLVEEGKLSLDAPVAERWPEFALAGKQQVTLRQLLAHRAGVCALRERLPGDALYDWERMTAAVAAEEPWWTPGSAHGYAPLTFGWLLGELIRRADGREPGAAIVARTAARLGLDLHIGLAEQDDERVAHVARGKGVAGDATAQRLLKVTLSDPAALPTLAFGNPSGVLTSTNKTEWRRFAQPAANGHGHARSLAGFYAGLLAGDLLEWETLSEALREHSQGDDRTLLAPTRFGLGFMLDQPAQANATFGLGAQAFGHPGAGGSVGFADPEHEVAFGFVTNTLGPYVLMDPRAQALARAVGACL